MSAEGATKQTFVEGLSHQVYIDFNHDLLWLSANMWGRDRGEK